MRCHGPRGTSTRVEGLGVANTKATWSVAVFAARESVDELEPTINSAARGLPAGATIDLLVNGNRGLAERTAELMASGGLSPRGASLRVWFIEAGDKSHAWNQYLEFIWPGSELAFFIDGYVRVRPDAFDLIAQGLENSPEHLAGTGVPTVGRSARSLRRQALSRGGIHGNLFVLKRETIERLRDIGFRLPLGLYRNDSTLGAVLAFNLDPASSQWNPKGRILVHADATWSTDKRSIWNWPDLSSQLRRVMRQSQGDLENLAVKNLLAIRKQSPTKLPRTVALLISQWAAEQPRQLAKAILRNPLAWLALRRVRAPRDWGAAASPPVRLWPPVHR